MDRPIVYTQEQGRSTDFLFGMRSAMIGLAKLSSAMLGANTLAHGFACTPNSPAALNVLVGLGEIYALAPVDGTAYGVLPADTTDTILKQGIQLGTTTLSCPAPTTTGFSINYLIEAGYQDSDTTQVVLPYFNSANPAQPLNGPGGLGGSNATERQGIVVLQAKAGTAATTGTQTTPAPDSGFVGLWVVTVAFGASTITSGNIAQYPSAPFITNILQMLQTGSSIYAADTSGTANTISLALTPPVTAYTDGEPIRFKAANTNTGAVTINWGGGNISLTGANGALQGGEIIALKQYEAIYSAATGTAILIGQSAGSLQVAPAVASQQAVQYSQVRKLLTANLSLFVATTGSDTLNTGLTSGSPFATLQHAYNFLQSNYDLNGFVATINVAAGTYTAGLNAQGAITGNVLGSAGVLVVGTSVTLNVGASQTCFSATLGARFSIQGFTMQASASSANAVQVNDPSSTITIGSGITFGAFTSGTHMLCAGGQIAVQSSYAVSGGASYHMLATNAGANIGLTSGITGTVSGTPAFSQAFAASQFLGLINAGGVTFSGSATGARYISAVNGAINTNGGGASYFPGSTAGSVSNGGVYV